MSLRTKIFIILPLVLSACLTASGQQAQDAAERAREEVCRRVPCRPPTTVRLKLNDKEYTELDFPKGPYVADGFINVLAGEELYVEFDEAEGRLTNPHYVKAAGHPERTVTLRLEQIEQGMLLNIKNPFARAIVYDCFIQRADEQRLRRTNVLPVGGKLENFEAWPYPVPQVVISNVRFAPPK
ncbi:MAG TPA: hypothetical protein VF791_00760 [Pyrinomonadaceae bacterium]